VDVTTEYDTQSEWKPDPFLGLEAGSWTSYGDYPTYLRGATPLVPVEDAIDHDDWNRVTAVVFQSFLPWYWRNARAEVGPEPHQSGTDTFYPALWRDRTVAAYSPSGYASKQWNLPPGWNGVTAAARYELAPTGLSYAGTIPVVNGTVTFGRPAGRATTLVPASTGLGQAPVGRTIALQSGSNNRYLVAWANQTDATLKANSGAIGGWERFQLVDAGGGYVALRAESNQRYVVAWANRSGNPLLARADEPDSPARAASFDSGDWERFRWSLLN
jgi:hypothetical protein